MVRSLRILIRGEARVTRFDMGIEFKVRVGIHSQYAAFQEVVGCCSEQLEDGCYIARIEG